MNSRSSFLSLFALSMALGSNSVIASSSQGGAEESGWLGWLWSSKPAAPASTIVNQDFEMVSQSSSKEDLTIEDKAPSRGEVETSILSNLEEKIAKANVMGKMQGALNEVLVIQADKRLKQTIAAELEDLKTSQDLSKKKMKAMEAATFALAHKQIAPKMKSSFEDRSLAETEFLNKFWGTKVKKLMDEIEGSHAVHQEELAREKWLANAHRAADESRHQAHIDFASKTHQKEIASLSAEVNAAYLKNIALTYDKATLEKDIAESKAKEEQTEEFYKDMSEDYRELVQDHQNLIGRFDGLSSRLDDTYSELLDVQWALGIAQVKLDETKESAIGDKQEAAYYRDMYAQLNMRYKWKVQGLKEQLQGALQEATYYRDLVARQGMLNQLKGTAHNNQETQVPVLGPKPNSSSSWAAMAKKKV